MPYKNLAALPKGVKNNLPKPAQEIYRQTFNHAWKTYQDPERRRGGASREEVSHRVALKTELDAHALKRALWIIEFGKHPVGVRPAPTTSANAQVFDQIYREEFVHA